MQERIRRFWNGRYKRHGKIYGPTPSLLGKTAVNGYFKKGDRILDLGGGYGRNSTFFAKHGFDATCMDRSERATKMAGESKRKKCLPNLTVVRGDALNLPFSEESFDWVFFNFVFNSFPEEGRKKMVEEAKKVLKKEGKIIASLLSTDDDNFGRGKKIEDNTFELMSGKPEHFFTRQEIEGLFDRRPEEIRAMDERELITDRENGRHITSFWFVVCCKGSSSA